MNLGHVIGGAFGLSFAYTAGPLPASGWAAVFALGLLQQTAPTLRHAWATAG
jgi:hypothetical protein